MLVAVFVGVDDGAIRSVGTAVGGRTNRVGGVLVGRGVAVAVAGSVGERVAVAVCVGRRRKWATVAYATVGGISLPSFTLVEVAVGVARLVAVGAVDLVRVSTVAVRVGAR